jgi:hypothetical protein
MYTVHWTRCHSLDGHYDLDSVEDLLADHAPVEHNPRTCQVVDPQDAYADRFHVWNLGFLDTFGG